MHVHQSPVDEAPLFAARLRPYRSLGRGGFICLMAFIVLVSLSSSALFAAAGAWPVVMFLCADAVLLWLAFKMNYYFGREYEEIAVWSHEIKVRKIAASGKITEHVFNPFWTRLRIDRHDEFGIIAIALTTRESELRIGAFLNPDDLDSFTDAFSQALASAKSG